MRRATALLLVVACGDATPSTYTIDTLANGAVLVVNHAPSGWSDSSGIALVLEHTIAPPDSASGELAFPLEVRTLGDGSIVVNDGGGTGILLFGADGTFDRVIGRHGEGPGEYGQIFSMATHGGTVFVQECNKARLTRFHLDGDSTTQWQSDDCMAGEGVTIDNEGAIWLDGRLREPTRNVLFRWVATGERADTFFLPARQQPALWTVDNGAIPIPFSAHSLNAGTPPLIWTGHGSTLAFHRVDARGDTVRVSSIPGIGAAIPDSVRQAVIDRIAASPQFASVVKLADVPTTHPLFSRMDQDEKGRLWVHRPASDGTTGHFEVLDSTGVWLGTVRAPAGAGREMHWANGRMYRISETAGGLPAVEIYRVDVR